jgi:hypothetical protein
LSLSKAALQLLGKIVNGADTDNTLWHQPEGAGLNAVAEGFPHLSFRNVTTKSTRQRTTRQHESDFFDTKEQMLAG